MADMTNVTNDLARAQSVFDNADELLNGPDGYARILENSKIGSPQYKDALKKYKELKPKYDAAKAELDKANKAYNDLKNANKAEADKNKSLKDTGARLDNAKQEYQKALDTQDQERITTAKQNLDSVRTEYQNIKTSTPASVNSSINTGTVPANMKAPAGTDPNVVNDFNGYTLGADGKLYAPGGTKGAYIVTVPGKNPGDVVSTPYASAADARKAYLTAYAQTPEKVAALKNQLVSSGYLTAAQAKTDTWFTGLDDFISAYSVHVVSEAQYNGVKQAILPTEYLTQKKVSGGGSGAGAIQYTTRGAAKQMLDQYVNDFIGRAATPAEHDAFYKQLIKAEGQAGTSGIAQAEVSLLVANTIRPSLKGTEVDNLLNTASGSQVAVDIHSLQEYAASYGVDMSASDAMKYVAAGLGQQDYVKKQEERIRNISIQMHPYLKDHILAGGTVADIADQYGKVKAQKLGVMVQDSTKEKDVMDAVSKGISLQDYGKSLQADPRWWNTQEAHTTVNNFIDKIAQTWGLG